ncbi:condensation domain-containing protein [Bacillus velezensis]
MDKNRYVPIPAAKEMPYYPVSSAQRRMYLLSHTEGGELTYNMTGAMNVEGTIDPERLNAAFRKLIARHEALRTSFDLYEGELSTAYSSERRLYDRTDSSKRRRSGRPCAGFHQSV